MTAGRAGDPEDPADGGAVNGAIVEEGVLGGKRNDIIRKDSDPQESSDLNVVEGGEVVLEGGVAGSDDTSGEVMPRKRLLRRWPSSADIGMVTDGR